MRITAAAALAAVLASAHPALAALNPQHAGLQVALRAQGLYLGPIDAVIGPKTVLPRSGGSSRCTTCR